MAMAAAVAVALMDQTVAGRAVGELLMDLAFLDFLRTSVEPWQAAGVAGADPCLVVQREAFLLPSLPSGLLEAFQVASVLSTLGLEVAVSPQSLPAEVQTGFHQELGRYCPPDLSPPFLVMEFRQLLIDQTDPSHSLHLNGPRCYRSVVLASSFSDCEDVQQNCSEQVGCSSV